MHLYYHIDNAHLCHFASSWVQATRKILGQRYYLYFTTCVTLFEGSDSFFGFLFRQPACYVRTFLMKFLKMMTFLKEARKDNIILQTWPFHAGILRTADFHIFSLLLSIRYILCIYLTTLVLVLANAPMYSGSSFTAFVFDAMGCPIISQTGVTAV